MSKPLLSVIVPTYNEKDNMEPLLTGLDAELKKNEVPYEIIVMDDNSPDGTAARCKEVAAAHKINARAVVRTENRGLSPAVIEGFGEARGDVLLVMDADLSHPIEAVPRLYRQIAENGMEVVVGSRHCEGGGIENWPLVRRLISFGASMMARPLTPCRDPMAGFFAIRPSVVAGVPLNAGGFKILLEILVKGRYSKYAEEPITFSDRIHGESKLSGGVMFSYIQHLIALYLYPGSASVFKYLFVGGLGTVVDVLIFTLLSAFAPLLVAQIFSFIASFSFCFILNSKWTFRRPTDPVPSAQEQRAQLLKNLSVSVACFFLRSVLYGMFAKMFDIKEAPATTVLYLLLIVVFSVFQFLASKLIFKTKADDDKKEA